LTTQEETEALKAAKRIVLFHGQGTDIDVPIEYRIDALLIARAFLAARGVREALEKCAAPWDSGPTTLAEAPALLSTEFQRRLNIAGEALAALSPNRPLAGEEK
jgi:hypothetical protein